MHLALQQQNLTVTVWAASLLVSRTHASSLSKLKAYSSSSSFVHLSRYCLQPYQYFQPSPPIYELLPQLFPYFLLCHSLCSWYELPDFFHQAPSWCIFSLSKIHISASFSAQLKLRLHALGFVPVLPPASYFPICSEIVGGGTIPCLTCKGCKHMLNKYANLFQSLSL